MNMLAINKRKILFIAIGLIIIFGLVSISKYPFGVSQYETIKIDMEAAQKSGTRTYWAPPNNVVPESNFYVYSLGDKSMCINGSCGMGGYFVQCLGGYIAGEKVRVEEFDYGLMEAGVDKKKIKIITVANKEGKIVGIYPGAHIRNLPYILSNHQNLFSKERFNDCSSELPTMWK